MYLDTWKDKRTIKGRCKSCLIWVHELFRNGRCLQCKEETNASDFLDGHRRDRGVGRATQRDS